MNLSKVSINITSIKILIWNLSEIIINMTSIKIFDIFLARIGSSFGEGTTLLRVFIGLVLKRVWSNAFLFKIAFIIDLRSIISECTGITMEFKDFIPCN